MTEIAERHGFEFVRTTAQGHYQWKHRLTGRLVITGSKCGSPRSWRNVERNFVARPGEGTTKWAVRNTYRR
jgi:hypothetical protein